MLRQSYCKTAQVDGPAHDGDVVGLDGAMQRLLDFQRGSRPLVLVFGSCTWPPFMADFGNICRMAADNADLADFVVVYIEEAHASDGWALSQPFYFYTTNDDGLQ